MPYIKTFDGKKLYYQKRGTPKTILIHGWLQDSTIWKDKGLTDYVALDLRNHGYSDNSYEFFQMDTYVKDIHTICTQFNIENPYLVGHSLGGMIALTYAIKYPTKGLLILNATGKSPFLSGIWKDIHAKNILNLFISLAPQNPKRKRFSYTKMKGSIELVLSKLSDQSKEELYGITPLLTFDITKSLKNIKCSCIFLAGNTDWQIPLADIKQTVT